MDPLSICASAASVVALVGTLTTCISRYIADVKSADKSVQQFVNCLTALQLALSSVEETFKKKPKQLDFERKHWEDINRILEACRHCVYQLNRELPQLQKDNNVAHRAYNQLLVYARSNIVTSLKAHISSYTQCLQVSMSAMMIVSQWQMQDSQGKIMTEIQDLRKEISDVTNVFRHRRLPSAASGRARDDDVLSDLTLEEIMATQNIEKWCGSAQAVAFSVSKLQPSQVSLAARAYDSKAKVRVWNTATESNTYQIKRLTGIDDDDDDESDGVGGFRNGGQEGSDVDSLMSLDPDLNGCPPLDILEEQIVENQRVANDKVEGRWYGAAERDQRRVISMYEQRERVYSIAFSNKAEMDEKLMNIFFGQGTPNALAAAKDILVSLYQQEKKAPTTSSRKSDLRHYLAMIYEAQGHPHKAQYWAFGALDERRSIGGDDNSTQETLRLVARLHRQLGEDTDAAVIERQLSRDEPSTTWSLRDIRRSITGEAEGPRNAKNLYTWLEANGFDSIESSDADNTPLQCAIAEENVDIVTSLAQESSKFELEVKNSKGATPLLLAASTRHKDLVAALLSAEADPKATDNEGNTALHRVQSSKGGVQVAMQLLSAPNTTPDFVNQRNRFGEAALHRAVRAGNGDMVEELLYHQAEINLRDSITGATPLHVAVYELQENMVRLLLDKGADCKIRDSKGTTPVQAAQQSNHALPTALTLLRKAQEAAGRQASVSTGPTTKGKSISGASVATAADSLSAQRTERTKSSGTLRRFTIGSRGS